MLPFKTGAVRIAIQAGVPILPVTVRGGNNIWPQGQKYPTLFRRVEIIYHPLFYVEDTGDRDDLAATTARLKEIIAGALYQ
jgi:1-acyl-sn-glycerol-3-phosphate acyltransferase